MMIRMRMVALIGVLAVVATIALPHLSRAGCGGGGRGFAFGRARATSGGSCGGGCNMNMGMSMPMNMNMAAPAAGATSYPAAPAAAPVAGHYYTCPMHPSVMSAAPGACPYCHMALSYH